MTPSGANRHCDLCQKDVVDFTKYTDQEIKEYFRPNPQNVCGRFRSEQLKIYPSSKSSRSLSRWLAIPFAASLLAPAVTYAQGGPSTEQVFEQHPKSKNFKQTFPRVVSGKVTDDSGEGLPGVNVVIKGTTRGVTTDLDGNYSIRIDEPSYLVFTSVGMQTQELKIGFRTIVNVSLVVDITELGETVITAGMATIYKPNSPIGIWWRIKGFFKRIF